MTIRKSLVCYNKTMEKNNVKRLTSVLKKYPITVAYIFGSVATDKAGHLSDIDIAILIDNKISKSERFDIRLRMSSKLSSLLNKKVDLVVLNDLPVQISYEIIKNGKVVLCTDKALKVDMEHDILSRYLDRRYYDKRHAEIVLDKLGLKGFNV